MHKYRRIIKFLVSGGSAALVEYIIFLALYHTVATSNLVLSQTLSFLGGFIVSFILNKTWVFESSAKYHSELIRYALLAAINLALGNIILWVLAEKIGVIYWASKLIVMILIATWNYILFSKIIFKKQ